MDCTISSQNALLVDKLMKTINTSTMSIDTTNKILLQLVSSDKTIVLDIHLKEAFFDHLELKKRLVTIPKQKFHMKKMKLLKIVQKEYVLTFEYVFDKYIFKRNIFHNVPSLFKIGFIPRYSGEINPVVLSEMSEEIDAGPTTFKASRVGEIDTGRVSIKFPIEIDDEFSVDLVGGNLKNVFSVSDLFTQVVVNYEAPDSPLNFTFIGAEMKASFFMATGGR